MCVCACVRVRMCMCVCVHVHVCVGRGDQLLQLTWISNEGSGDGEDDIHYSKEDNNERYITNVDQEDVRNTVIEDVRTKTNIHNC